jgi:hypothetical protein
MQQICCWASFNIFSAMESCKARACCSQGSTQGNPSCFASYYVLSMISSFQAPGNLSVGEAVAIGLLGAEGVLFFCAGEIIGRGRYF